MKTYKKYDREKYLTEFATIMELRPVIERYMDEIFEKGVDNLFFGGGG